MSKPSHKQTVLTELCLKLKEAWTPKDGVVAILYSRDGTELYKVTCGKASNPSLMAAKCRLWHGDRQLYYGRLDPKSLGLFMNLNKACMALITTVRDMQNEKPSRCRVCLGSKCNGCQLKYVEPVVV